MSDDVELQVLTDYVRREAGYSGALGGDDDLIEKGILDSFNIVELVLYAQQHFAVEFEDTDMARDNFACLNSLAALIRKRRPGT